MHGWKDGTPSFRSLYAIFIRVRIVTEKSPEMMMNGGRRQALWGLIALVIATVAAYAAGQPARACRQVELEGEVSAGQGWKAALGQGWIFRVLPIDGYSGWDLVVDRDPPAGYPDALLLATPPYGSINEREIGTTFGLRAQDAIGWNTRSFRFLTDAAQFGEAQQWFRQSADGGPNSGARNRQSMQRLLDIRNGASSGQLRILDARVVPGTRDPQSFAREWALAFSRTQHKIEPVAAGQATTDGRLIWMRFSLTLWFPDGWKFPVGVRSIRARCPE